MARPPRLRLAVASLAAGASVLAGCGDGSTVGTPSCTREDAGGACEVVGLVFRGPLTLVEVEELATEADGEPVALWRADAVCVTAVSSTAPQPPPPGGYGSVRSAFAYYRADEIVARQEQGPPATDGGWSTALRQRFLEEWRAAGADGVRFAGAAVLVPAGRAAGRPGVGSVAPLEWYRVDATGVIYLRGHDVALRALFPEPAGACP